MKTIHRDFESGIGNSKMLSSFLSIKYLGMKALFGTTVNRNQDQPSDMMGGLFQLLFHQNITSMTSLDSPKSPD